MDKDLEITKVNSFLEKYGLVDEFWQEVQSHQNKNPKYIMWEGIEREPNHIINYAFTWRDTKKGSEFWNDIHLEYEETYRNIELVKATDLAKFMYPEAIVYKNYLVINNS
jgi:hypothetical protein